MLDGKVSLDRTFEDCSFNTKGKKEECTPKILWELCHFCIKMFKETSFSKIFALDFKAREYRNG
jgi:hypothetical protein